MSAAGRPTTRTLLLLNGAPGVGKSTLAERLAAVRPRTVALDVDAIKHALSGWPADPEATGLEARRIALIGAGAHLRAGEDVVIGQYLARPEFVEQLDDLVRREAGVFVEVVLVVDVRTLARRLAARHANPDRREHVEHNQRVGPPDAPALVSSVDAILRQRPDVQRVDARGALVATLAQVRSVLDA